MEDKTIVSQGIAATDDAIWEGIPRGICTIYTNDCVAHALLYFCQLLKGVTDRVEIMPLQWLQDSRFVDFDDVDKIQDIYFVLGEGIHKVEYEGAQFRITVDNFINCRELLANRMSSDIIKQVYIEFMKGNDMKADFMKLINDSKIVWKGLCERLKTKRKDVIKKYIFDAEGYWEFMSTTELRPPESLFLREGQRDKLLEYVKNFLNPETKKEYMKFNVPYKCNILLHGSPGSGKTSTCLVVASYVNTNIGIIPVSRGLDDAKLIRAINNVTQNDCKIIIIEDVDCLFEDRKALDTTRNSLTLSGILNCLDGLCRNDGIIVFLTTNNVNALDRAMVRSSRIDFRMEYSSADEHQTKECFRYFCPNHMHEFESFWERVRHKKYTISNLQEFLWQYRKENSINKHVKAFFDIIEETKTGSNDADDSMQKLYC